MKKTIQLGIPRQSGRVVKNQFLALNQGVPVKLENVTTTIHADPREQGTVASIVSLVPEETDVQVSRICPPFSGRVVEAHALLPSELDDASDRDALRIPEALRGTGTIVSRVVPGTRDTQQGKGNRRRMKRFRETSAYEVYYLGKTGEILLTNFVCDVTNIFTLKRWGFPKPSTAFVLTVTRHSDFSVKGRLFDAEVEAADGVKALKAIKEHDPACIVFADLPNANARFGEYIAEKYAVAEEKFPPEKRSTVFDIAGWAETAKGEHRYLSADDDNCRSMRRMPKGSDFDAASYITYARTYLLSVAKSAVAVPLFLHMHAGYVAALLEEAQHPLQYILNLAAPTGSFKTTLAEAFFLQFGVEKLNFTATDVSWELLAVQGHDASIVLDDLHDATSKELMAKFERFQRQYGDSSARGKSANGGATLVRKPMRCAVTMTSEATLDNLKLSGKLRLACLEYSKRDIDKKILRKISNDIAVAHHEHTFSPVEIYISCFIRFVEEHYEELFKYAIRFEAPDIGLKAERLKSTFAVFSLLSAFVVRFWKASGIIDAEGCDELCRKWGRLIGEWILANEEGNLDTDPLRMFLSAVDILVAQRALAVSTDREAFMLQATSSAGFWETHSDGNKRLCLDASRCYDSVAAFYRRKGLQFSLAEKDALRLVYDNGLSEGYAQKDRPDRPYKRVKVNGASIKIIVLKWKNINNYLYKNKEDLL